MLSLLVGCGTTPPSPDAAASADWELVDGGPGLSPTHADCGGGWAGGGLGSRMSSLGSGLSSIGLGSGALGAAVASGLSAASSASHATANATSTAEWASLGPRVGLGRGERWCDSAA